MKLGTLVIAVVSAGVAVVATVGFVIGILGWWVAEAFSSVLRISEDQSAKPFLFTWGASAVLSSFLAFQTFRIHRRLRKDSASD